MKNFLAQAERIVREAGQMARQMSSSAQVRKHKDWGDLVTDGDLAVEEHVISSLKELFPDHGFDSEESGSDHSEAEYKWILDPIDGTKYYARNVPLYSVSLALTHRGRLSGGIVYCPEFDHMYCAQKGAGAFLNGHPIRCSKAALLEDATICLEIPSRDSPEQERRQGLEAAAVLVAESFRVRILGVAALGLCFTAAGGFDAYVNLGSGSDECDTAAGEVILREAGGEFHRVGSCMIAGPAKLCERIRGVLGT